MQKRPDSSQSHESIGGDAANRLAGVFSDVLSLPRDRVHPDLGPADVGQWDSVGHVVLIAAIEEAFSIHFDVDEILEFTSFRAILSAIERRIAASAA
jgi:acyl carrier protein